MFILEYSIEENNKSSNKVVAASDSVNLLKNKAEKYSVIFDASWEEYTINDRLHYHLIVVDNMYRTVSYTISPIKYL